MSAAAIAAGVAYVVVKTYEELQFEEEEDLTPEDVELCDSMKHLRLVSAVEEEFQVKLSMQEIESRRSLGALQTLIDHTQQSVNGWVRVKLYKGNVIVVSRDSKTDSLFDMTIATFDEDGGAYNQADAGGFIKLNALRMRIAAKARAARGK